MKKLTLADIRPPKVYERARDRARAEVMARKRDRRVALGDCVTLVFENRLTMTFQVEEMVRAEQLEDPRKIQAEIDVYNSLLPGPGELAGTLFVEITDSEAIRATLHRLVGIDEQLRLAIGEVIVPAQFEAGRSEADRISSVQYLRFPLPARAQELLQQPGTRLELACDLPRYRQSVVLPETTRASLAEDLL